jgi:hypothetical protein
MKITPEVIAAHNLTQEEFQRIVELLGREPTLTSLESFPSCGPSTVRTSRRVFT